MSPNDCRKHALASVELASGRPVVLNADDKLPNEAVIRIAAGDAPAHVLKYRPSSEAELPYLVCFQCEMALRAVLAPRDERFSVASTSESYKAVRTLVDVRNPAWRQSLRDDAVAEYSRMLTDGLGTQLRSVPVGLRIDQQIHDTQPQLRQMQKTVAERQLDQNTAILAPNVRENVPDLIYRASAGMNACLAIFWARYWGNQAILVPYEMAGFLRVGEKLMALLDSLPAARMHDRELVTAWADTLGIGDLFQIGPVGL